MRARAVAWVAGLGWGLVGCPSQDSAEPEVETFAIGGTVSGVSGPGLVLQDLGHDDLAVDQDGTFRFDTEIADGSRYFVTVLATPDGQTCAVSNATGTVAGADVTDVVVTCSTDTYTLSATVAGLTGTGLVLDASPGGTLSPTADGVRAFPTALPDGTPWTVTVTTQPSSPSQECEVSPETGTISGADAFVAVVCVVTEHTVGGTVSGLVGTGLVLQNNAGDDEVITADGDYTFDTALVDGSRYNVSVLGQPTGPAQTCTVANPSGVVSGADVEDIDVTCAADTFTVSGTVVGLVGSPVEVQINGGGTQTRSTDGAFTFPPLADGSAYRVTVSGQPTAAGQTCEVTSGETGTLAGADVTGVVVTCDCGAVAPGTVHPETDVMDQMAISGNWELFSTAADDGEMTLWVRCGTVAHELAFAAEEFSTNGPGDPAWSIPGATLTGFSPTRAINTRGQYVVTAEITGIHNPIPNSYDPMTALYTGRLGAPPELVVRTGMLVGQDVLSDISAWFALNERGQIGFKARRLGRQDEGEALYRYTPGVGIEELIGESTCWENCADSDPGNDRVIRNVWWEDTAPFNARGHFAAQINVLGREDVFGVVLVRDPDDHVLVAAPGTSAPGGVWQSASNPALNGDDEIVFQAELCPSPGVDTDPDEGFTCSLATVDQLVHWSPSGGFTVLFEFGDTVAGSLKPIDGFTQFYAQYFDDGSLFFKVGLCDVPSARCARGQESEQLFLWDGGTTVTDVSGNRPIDDIAFWGGSPDAGTLWYRLGDADDEDGGGALYCWDATHGPRVAIEEGGTFAGRTVDKLWLPPRNFKRQIRGDGRMLVRLTLDGDPHHVLVSCPAG